MKYCRKCGHKLSGSERFCGECGAPLQTATPSDPAAQTKDSAQNESYGPETDSIISFFEGKKFRTVCWILIVFGITYAFLSGGLLTSGVPSPTESYQMKHSPANWNRIRPAAPARRREDSTRPGRRFNATQGN